MTGRTILPLNLPSAVATMAPLPSEGITPGMEEQMKEWLESYRPVRQRTVRSETTKDEAGALPPAVCAVQPIAHQQALGRAQIWLMVQKILGNVTEGHTINLT